MTIEWRALAESRRILRRVRVRVRARPRVRLRVRLRARLRVRGSPELGLGNRCAWRALYR